MGYIYHSDIVLLVWNVGMVDHTLEDYFKDSPEWRFEVSPLSLQVGQQYLKARNPARLSRRELENFDVYS